MNMKRNKNPIWPRWDVLVTGLRTIVANRTRGRATAHLFGWTQNDQDRQLGTVNKILVWPNG